MRIPGLVTGTWQQPLELRGALGLVPHCHGLHTAAPVRRGSSLPAQDQLQLSVEAARRQATEWRDLPEWASPRERHQRGIQPLHFAAENAKVPEDRGSPTKGHIHGRSRWSSTQIGWQMEDMV